jgi:hypothetical protein
MWYHWIDKEQPEWANKEIQDRHRQAWADFKEEEAAAKSKAVRERWLQKHREEQNECLDDWGKRLDAKRVRIAEKERVSKELHEAERVQKRERDAQAKAAEEHDDKTGKWQKIDSR